jgi:hypothetical protein
MNMVSALVLGTLVAVGIALGGWFTGDGFRDGRAETRYVTVKGLSERDAKADLAFWPLQLIATSNDLAEAQSKLLRDTNEVRTFLKAAGFTDEEMSIQNVKATDLMAQQYRSGPIDSRYVVGQTLMVRTEKVDALQQVSQNIGELVSRGVVLNSEGNYYGAGGPSYVFTKLNDVKPEMIAQATKNARESAEQFARDSGSKVGYIRRANQGVFQILPRDASENTVEASQIFKTVRVVTTVDYYLED